MSPLLHIGYMKTGSTWLQTRVLNDPAAGLLALASREALTEILVRPSVLDYDAEAVRALVAGPLAVCEKRGLVPVISHERLSGNPISGGFDSTIVADRLAELFPMARVAIVIREQRSFLTSFYNEYVCGGGACSLASFLHPPPGAKLPLFNARFLEYHRLIEYYHEAFGRERVLVLPFETLARDRLAFCNRLDHVRRRSASGGRDGRGDARQPFVGGPRLATAPELRLLPRQFEPFGAAPHPEDQPRRGPRDARHTCRTRPPHQAPRRCGHRGVRGPPLRREQPENSGLRRRVAGSAGLRPRPRGDSARAHDLAAFARGLWRPGCLSRRSDAMGVTVIIPAYNVAPYLEAAVASVLAQTAPDVDAVIVDDGSTDGTLPLARSLEGPRVRVISDGRNRGPSAARNRAIDAARGEWVAVLDADDWYAPERLERLLAVADEEEADFVIDDQHIVRDGEATPFTTQFQTAREPLRQRRVLDPIEFVRSNRPGFAGLRFGSGKALMRRSFLNAHGLRYDERICGVEDSVLYVRSLARGARFVAVPEAYYYRRKRAGSITAGLVRMIENDIEVNAQVVEEPLIRSTPGLERALRQRLAGARSHLAFLRVRRALGSLALGEAVRLAAGHPAVLPFAVRKLADGLSRRGAGAVTPSSAE